MHEDGFAVAGAGRRLPELDGIRGIAILSVLLCHFTLYGAVPQVSGIWLAARRLALSGWVGVDLFFVLSGFLITSVLYDTKAAPHYFRNFFARRALRIFPVYFLCLLVVLHVLSLWMPSHPELLAAKSQEAWYFTYTSNLLVARDGWPERRMFGHFWSLAVEEQFYVVWPLAVLLLTRERLVTLCAACLMLSPLLRLALHELWDPTAAYVLTPARMDAMAAGAIVALLARSKGGLAPYRQRVGAIVPVVVVLLVAMVVVARGFDPERRLVQAVGYTLLAVTFSGVLLLAITNQQSLLARLLRGRILRLLGRYSYGLYVYHKVLISLLLPSLLTWILPLAWHSEVLARCAAVSVTAGATLLLAIVSWHGFEQPILSLKRWFSHVQSSAGRDPAARCASRP